MPNMKATIVKEEFDKAGNFIGVVLVENKAETWSSGGAQVHFAVPDGQPKHTKASLKAALKDYAEAHAVQCTADLARGTPIDTSTIDTVDGDTGNESAPSAKALELRARLTPPAGV